MTKLLLVVVITLFFTEGCVQKETKLPLITKEILSLKYQVNSKFGFSKDSILFYCWTGKTDVYDASELLGDLSGLYKPDNDSIVRDKDFFKNEPFNERSFTKKLKQKSIYIDDIYKKRFMYDVIEDSFNLYPSGGALATNIIKINKPIGDTTSLIYQFSKKENVSALKEYKNYWIYLTNDTSKICKAFVNIFDTITKQKCKIETDFCVSQLNFLLYDIMNDEKPEIILFYTPVFMNRDLGTLKVFKMAE